MGHGRTESKPEMDDVVSQKIIKTLLTVFLFLPVMSQAEQMTLEVIPLKYRLTDDIIPIIQPLVAPGGTVSGMNNQLIIKTTPSNLAEIKNVLDSIDQAPRQLLITVKQDIGGQIHLKERSLSGKYSSGDVTISSDDPGRPDEGPVIMGGDEDSDFVRYRALSRDTAIDDKNTFRVRATEGYPAFINTGQSVPIPSRTEVVTPHGVVVEKHTEYYGATSGFYVLPRLNGDQVTLLISPHLTRVHPGKPPVFDTQNVETTANGRLGEWIPIGGIDQSFDDKDRRIFSSAESQGQEARTVLIRVDEVK